MDNQALYLKWRPQTFEDVIGQDHITTTLRNSLQQNRVRHAYLFSGPRGTGKTTTARLLAKAVNCQHDDLAQHPCNDCHNCIAVSEGRFFDLIEIDAASHTGVDDVRDLRDKIAFAPSEGRFKVYIIDEVHRFSSAAFDALLKTLEEPPAHAIFVLATTEYDKVPATIKSRCLMFEFRRVSVREVAERLQLICEDEGISIEPSALELIARQGTGSVRDSISLLDQVVADPNQHVTLQIAQQMLGAVGSQAVQGIIEATFDGNAALALDLLNEAVDMGAAPRQFGEQIVEHLRQVMLVQIGGANLVDASDEMRAILEDHAGMIQRESLLKALRNFNTALNDARGGWQPQLPLEMAIVESIPAEEALPPEARAKQRFEKTRGPTQDELPPPTDAPSETIDIGFQDMVAGWSQVLDAPEFQRTSIPALLKQSHPLRLDGSTLVLGMPSAMLKSKTENHLDEVAAVLESVFGQKINVRLEVAGEGTPEARDDDLESFGVNELGAEISELD